MTHNNFKILLQIEDIHKETLSIYKYLVPSPKIKCEIEVLKCTHLRL